MSDETIWIFGYGSLVWRPAFRHLQARPASIEGYSRRFWQGSTDHRGVPERPGRVVTLLADDDAYLHAHADAHSIAGARCWGSAYQIPSHDPDDVLGTLDHRERAGYERVELEIELMDVDAAETSETNRNGRHPTQRRLCVSGLVYIAGPGNENFLGAASIEAIASQIATASGPSGSNPEYVFELAERLRAMRVLDEHVFAVEEALLRVMDVSR